VTSRPRRDFLLDSGGVSALAANRDLLVAYLELLKLRFTGALLIPIPVLTEVRSGQRRSDALVDRLIKAIGAEDEVYAPLTAHAAARAGVLRAQASSRSRHGISTTDAQIVAMAEERSYTCAVTIVTGDSDDINLLVGLTLRTNIAVDVLG
jgi:predicted nucleic acid-binding protein